MTANELRQKYLDFFKSKGHAIIPSASLVPENDPSVLFTTAGMHPLVPYLLGQKHPSGTRLVDYQKCIRTGDIDEVGDNTHLTFFEMLGNWSLGDYFKDESIQMSFDFLTSELGIPLSKLAFSVFEGDDSSPFDQESFDKWIALGVTEDRIAKLGKDDNWWPAGGKHPGPQGPDTEIFYWTPHHKGAGQAGDEEPPKVFDPSDKRWVEIWNNVFMQFNKTDGGVLSELAQQNVDTGMGLERTLAALNGKASVYDTDLFVPILKAIPEGDEKSRRIIADHIRTAVMMIADGVIPANKDQGYILRRLIRRAVRQMLKLSSDKKDFKSVAESAIRTLEDAYPMLKEKRDQILEELKKEQDKFQDTVKKGLRQLDKLVRIGKNEYVPDGAKFPIFNRVDAKAAFDIYQTYGFPLEMIEEELAQRALVVDKDEFKSEFDEYMRKHQDLSRTASAGKFKGGLADNGEETTKLHTATHLMLAGLRKYLGEGVHQAGSNITAERSRFDFTWDEKVSREILDKVEAYVNEAIEKGAEMKLDVMPKEKAQAEGVEGSFWEKYPAEVNVFTVVGDNGTVYSKELCGGPHVKTTKGMGKFKIIKEESSSAGVRRIKAILE
ncbi:alanine--tRNA ligase [Candidatus Uhrbacteria bacterium CG_4_9_14_0_2_um_filter_41_50]|uniref:alanine--tRNA ligase n=1 Tax=Candidatus Uhrbacteria bacterium CG_4_9_14_0_2_um_filter_41_50 TaxID=1975031 RepID=A0A2M8EPV7_9BACT|nr:MAG: alanine--tRNA ligase [Candidatus Uhrbacteria bacterium CG_4_9_14_0_8_um_filter_41_16]PJC24785.1 MAG: alanine--tRNA ligase [Candidatus Uhrbacteria bacterium CG_4_9_14_0_2_um_filter_41_50]